MIKKLTQAECQRLHNVERLSFTEIGKKFAVTRQAAYSIYHYSYTPRDHQRKRGPKGAKR